MNQYKNQKQEIETIKERTIKLKLSDADCERISEKAGLHGLTIGELLESFIGDLINGTYSNGSDERDKASDWFERCWFGMFPNKTLLRHLLSWQYDVENFIDACDELKYKKNHPELFVEDNEKPWFEEEYEEATKDFLKKHPDADMEKEIEACRKWLENLQNLKK